MAVLYQDYRNFVTTEYASKNKQKSINQCLINTGPRIIHEMLLASTHALQLQTFSSTPIHEDKFNENIRRFFLIKPNKKQITEFDALIFLNAIPSKVEGLSDSQKKEFNKFLQEFEKKVVDSQFKSGLSEDTIKALLSHKKTGLARKDEDSVTNDDLKKYGVIIICILPCLSEILKKIYSKNSSWNNEALRDAILDEWEQSNYSNKAISLLVSQYINVIAGKVDSFDESEKDEPQLIDEIDFNSICVSVIDKLSVSLFSDMSLFSNSDMKSQFIASLFVAYLVSYREDKKEWSQDDLEDLVRFSVYFMIENDKYVRKESV